MAVFSKTNFKVLKMYTTPLVLGAFLFHLPGVVLTLNWTKEPTISPSHLPPWIHVWSTGWNLKKSSGCMSPSSVCPWRRNSKPWRLSDKKVIAKSRISWDKVGFFGTVLLFCCCFFFSTISLLILCHLIWDFLTLYCSVVVSFFELCIYVISWFGTCGWYLLCFHSKKVKVTSCFFG